MTNPAPQKPAPEKPGPRARRIGDMLRVDHAGEYGAVSIYRGQRAVFDKLPHKARTAELLKEMEDGEAHHLETFDRLLAELDPDDLSPREALEMLYRLKALAPR